MNAPLPVPVRQRGAALIVGLVLMTVLTLLAVSTMRTSTLELAMAGNMQYHEQAVQLAEAGIADAISRIEQGAINPQPVPDWVTPFSAAVADPQGGSLGHYDVTVRYKNECGETPSGSSRGQLQADFFEIESVGRSSARNAKSVIRRGFWIMTPSCI